MSFWHLRHNFQGYCSMKKSTSHHFLKLERSGHLLYVNIIEKNLKKKLLKWLFSPSDIALSPRMYKTRYYLVITNKRTFSTTDELINIVRYNATIPVHGTILSDTVLCVLLSTISQRYFKHLQSKYWNKFTINVVARFAFPARFPNRLNFSTISYFPCGFY